MSAKPLFFRYFYLILKGLANLSRISICRFIMTAILMNYIGVAACVRNLAGAAATRAEGCDSPFLLIPSDFLSRGSCSWATRTRELRRLGKPCQF